MTPNISTADMQASTDARVKAIIANELGHLRSYCDLEDMTEESANRYAELWGFPCVDSLYKTSECDELQKFARQVGMSWRIFYVDDFFGTSFTCLKPGERVQAKYTEFIDIGADSEEVRDHMRALPPECYVKQR